MIPIRSSYVLALQNPYLGPAIITRGFIFFIFRMLRIETKLCKGIYHHLHSDIIRDISLCFTLIQSKLIAELKITVSHRP